jgi:hypothetical protein
MARKRRDHDLEAAPKPEAADETTATEAAPKPEAADETTATEAAPKPEHQLTAAPPARAGSDPHHASPEAAVMSDGQPWVDPGPPFVPPITTLRARLGLRHFRDAEGRRGKQYDPTLVAAG